MAAVEKWKRKAAANAFTLTELMVSVAIVGILAALLLPSLSVAKSYGRSASCKNHLHQMGIALKMYVEDHQATYPYYLGPAGQSYGDEKGPNGKGAGLVYWSSKLFPYYSLNWTNSSFHCPAYKGKITGPYSKSNIERLGSYAYNLQGSAGHGLKNRNFGLGPVITWKVPPVSERQISAPSDMLSIGESRFLTAGEVAVPFGSVQGLPGGSDVMRCGNPKEMFDPARHGKKYNQLFCDGHVSAISPWDLFNPTNTAAMWNYDHQPHPELWW